MDRTRTAKILRIFLPALIVLIWTAVAGVGGPYFGRVSEVSSNDQTSYLPATADATLVAVKLEDFRDSNVIPAVALFVSETPFTDQQSAEVQSALSTLGSAQGLADPPSPPISSEDGMALQAFIALDTKEDIADSVAALASQLEGELPANITVYVAGPAALTADLLGAFAGIDGILLAVALAAVLIILVVVYRSLFLPLAVLSTSMFALTSALLVVWWLAKAEILMLSGQTQGILFILVIGAATDYSLLYVARFREQLRLHRDTWVATKRAVRGSAPAILASGSTVIAGLLMLLLSDLKSNSSLGPVASVGILFAMASALTLLPSILLLTGRKIFWPRTPAYDPALAKAQDGMPASGVWPWIAPKIAKHPRAIWLGTAALLAVGAAFAPTLNATGVSQSELVLGDSPARDAQAALSEHFPGGSGSPTYVLAPETDLQDVADTLLSDEGVASLSVLSTESPAGSAPVTADGIMPLGPPGTPAPAPTVVDGSVMLQATLNDPADSMEAEQTVANIRAQFDEGEGVMVGGTTATALDTNAASIHDRNLIIPLVLLVIFLILVVLLRSILAPILLIATTVLSFATALGVAAIVFNHVLDLPGADPAVPLYGFVFLVALGIDYNIFLMTRVREESISHGTRQGILRGLGITGGVITSAGLVLAATFAALSVIPILFLLQISFIVSFGVLLDTFLVRSLLVPALSYDIGRTIWWPSKLARGRE